MNKKIIYSLGLSFAVFQFACGSDNNTTDGSVNADATAGNADASAGDTGGGGTPAAPVQGALIDRMGRAAVNTALTDPFDSNAANEDTMKDSYNHTTKDMWGTWKAPIAKSLGVYDTLDGMCGNQLAAGMMPVAGRY